MRTWIKGTANAKSYWRASIPMGSVVDKTYMHDNLGMYLLMDDRKAVQERCLNRPLPNGTMGGVRGQAAN